MDATLEREVAERARREGCLRPGESVLVAVSGGADSAATAGLLASAGAHGLPLRCVLGHVDHGWRGPAEAARDREEVERLAGILGLPLACEGPPVDAARTEDDARRHRYGALARMARAHACTTVATGHHLRDQAETLVMRLLRGSGAAGLAGIPVRRPLDGATLWVVRPVLWVDPARLRAYAAARGLPWREDPTNAVLDRDRARVRARLVALGDRAPSVVADLAALADRLRRRVGRREALVAERLAPGLRAHAGARCVEASLAAVAGLPPGETATALRLMGRALAADARGPWFARRHAALVEALVRGGAERGVVALPRGREVRRAGRRLWLVERDAPPPPPVALAVQGGARACAGAVWASVTVVPAQAFDLGAWRAAHRAATEGSRPPWHAALDADALGPEVVLRPVAPADRFRPWAGPAPVRVADWLSRRGVPGWKRRGTLVATAADGRVAWVVGHRVAADFAVGPTTCRVAVLLVDERAPSAALPPDGPGARTP